MTTLPIGARQTVPQNWTGIRRRSILPILVALAIGLLLRLWFVAHAGQPDGDSLIYGDIAKSWLQHGIYGFGQDAGLPRPTLIRLPGYPIFLAFCFRFFGLEHYNAVLYAQVAFDLLSCLAIGALAGRLFGRRSALAALWIATLCPFTAAYTAKALAETLSLTCIAISFYSLHLWQQSLRPTSQPSGPTSPYNRWLFLLAAALSYAILLRPEQVLLAAAVLPAMLWLPSQSRRSVTHATPGLRRATPALLTAFLVILPLIPWTIRNWNTFHVFQPLAPHYATDPGEAIPTGFQDWYRTWGIDFASTQTAYWNYNGSPIAIGDLPTRAFDSSAQFSETDTLLRDYNRTVTDSPALNARFEALARERIAAHPIRYYVTLPAARLINMIFRPRVELLPVQLEWWQFRAHPGQTLFSLAYGALNFAYFALAGAGLNRWRKITRNTNRNHSSDGPSWRGLPLIAWAMIASIFLRSALLVTLDNSEPRYTLEFFPILIVCAAATFREAHDREPTGEVHPQR